MAVIRSRKYLDGARGSNCTIRIPGVCDNNVETVISAHIRDGIAGMSIKASDISTASCCHACHEVFDRRSPLPNGEHLSREDWLFYALRGLQETLEQRVAAGLLVLPQDIETPSHAKPVKPRKPRAEREKIAQPKETRWPKRPFPNRQKDA